MRDHLFLFVLLAALVLSGCGAGQTSQSVVLAPTNTITPLSTEEVYNNNAQENPIELNKTPTAEVPSNPPPVDKFINLTKNDLAKRLQIDTDKVELVKSEEVLWPDAALGCPAPGKVYAQGKVPGFQIQLKASESEYIYHTDWTGQFVLCPIANPDVDLPLPGGSGPTPDIGVPIK